MARRLRFVGEQKGSEPPRIFGLNYVEHAAESKMKVQSVATGY